jgi:hypothetical protein
MGKLLSAFLRFLLFYRDKNLYLALSPDILHMGLLQA